MIRNRDTVASASYAHPSPYNPSLRQLLRLNRIPVETWGNGKSKTFKDLCRELSKGESFISFGVPSIRQVRIVRVAILDFTSKQVLVETHRRFPGGKNRLWNQYLSGKVIRKESATQAMQREVYEELNLRSSQYTAGKKRVWKHTEKSKSYPGLLTHYIITQFIVRLKRGVIIPDRYESKDKETGIISIFRWTSRLKI